MAWNMWPEAGEWLCRSLADKFPSFWNLKPLKNHPGFALKRWFPNVFPCQPWILFRNHLDQPPPPRRKPSFCHWPTGLGVDPRNQQKIAKAKIIHRQNVQVFWFSYVIYMFIPCKYQTHSKLGGVFFLRRKVPCCHSRRNPPIAHSTPLILMTSCLKFWFGVHHKHLVTW